MTEQNKPDTLDDANCEDEKGHCHGKQPPAEAGEAVAWMWEWYGSRYDDAPGWNTTIEASKPADWELNNSEFPIRNLRPLYTSQTTATQAAVAAAMRKCAEICRKTGADMDEQAKSIRDFTYKDALEEVDARLSALIPAEATAALDAYVTERVCAAIESALRFAGISYSNAQFDTIVRDVLNKPANGGGKE